MFGHLFSKTALFLAALFLITVTLLGLYMVVTVANINAEATQQMHRHLADHILHESPLLPENLSDKKAVKDAFHLMMVFGPNLELYILDEQGEIVNYSADANKIIRNRVSLQPIRQFISDSNSRLVLGEDPRSDKNNKPFSVARINHNEELVGYLYIILGSELYDNAISGVLSERVVFASLPAIGLLLLSTVLTAIFIYVTIAKPLNQLVLRLQKTNLEQTNLLQTPVDNAVAEAHSSSRVDEIARVEREFDRFFAKIRNQYKLLEDKKNAQHMLFNQIAHDLRTPLSNAILSLENAERQLADKKFESLKQSLASARGNYKKVVSFISNMLDLARLESGQTKLSTEPFPLEELVHDCVQDFLVAAGEQQLELVVKADNRYRLVNIDISHLSRVLNNLIGNSIRYALPGSKIELSLIEKDDAMCFTITNRFNRDAVASVPDLSGDYQFKATSKLGYGLGLAICQRILRLHASQLSLDKSQQDQLSFHFSLPLCEVA